MDKTHLVYFSPTGGVRKVGLALIADLNQQVLVHDFTLPESREMLEFGREDFVIFAFPVYGGRAPRNTEAIFAKISGKNAPCAIVAVYGNRAWEGALLDLDRIARSKGFKPVAAAAAIAQHSMAPQIATGRPDKEDQRQLAVFGRQMHAAAHSEKFLEKAPGEFPKWHKPEGMHLFPGVEAEKCVGCVQCVSVCPAGAISVDEPGSTDWQKCILCAACMNICPERARFMGTEETRAFFSPHLVEAAAKRREPELFLP